jgi:methyltransferase (TIGR00027 family)
MTRSDDDQWDLGTSVGKTAMLVAQGRAMETLADDPLIVDEFAASFLRAAGQPVPERIPGAETATSAGAVSLVYLVSARTRFFDEYVDAAVAAGIGQFVFLAAGLDARGFRMHWPPESVVYEIDQPQVIDFKDRVLAEIGATPSCVRRTIGCDLRGEWVGALRSEGFDPATPTAWLAEALTPYLPETAQEQLFGSITALSAPGSWLSFDVPGASVMDAAKREQALRAIETEFEFQLDELVYADRPVPDEMLGMTSDYVLKTARTDGRRT